VRFPPGAAVDPGFDDLDLRVGQLSIRIRRRHTQRRIRIADLLVDLARCRIAGHDNTRFGKGTLFGIEMQARHTVLLVRAMAGEAVIGEYRSDLAIEIDGWGRRKQRRYTEQRTREQEQGTHGRLWSFHHVLLLIFNFDSVGRGATSKAAPPRAYLGTIGLSPGRPHCTVYAPGERLVTIHQTPVEGRQIAMSVLPSPS